MSHGWASDLQEVKIQLQQLETDSKDRSFTDLYKTQMCGL